MPNLSEGNVTMNKKDLKDIIDSDLKRYSNNASFMNLVKSYIKNSGFRFTYILRKCQYYKNKNKLIYIFFKFLKRKYKFKYGYEIPDEVIIGKGVHIYHLGHIIINPSAEIGDYFTVNDSVTIGQTYRGSKKGVPKLGDKVWVGSNAVIVGNVTIGDNVLIAPNAYINFDVPNDSIVIGNPAKIIHDEHATRVYIDTQ